MASSTTESGGVLSIHIWSGIFVFLGVANGNWILAENLQIYSFYRTIIGSIINIFLNLFLLPIYGIKGAALATLISYSFASYFSMAFFKNSKANFILSSSSFNPIAVFKRITSLKDPKIMHKRLKNLIGWLVEIKHYLFRHHLNISFSQEGEDLTA